MVIVVGSPAGASAADEWVGDHGEQGGQSENSRGNNRLQDAVVLRVGPGLAAFHRLLDLYPLCCTAIVAIGRGYLVGGRISDIGSGSLSIDRRLPMFCQQFPGDGVARDVLAGSRYRAWPARHPPRSDRRVADLPDSCQKPAVILG